MRKSKVMTYSRLFLGAMILLNLITVNTFSPVKSEVDWWNVGWSYRRAITIDHTKVNANLWNFPILIDVNNPDLAAKAQADGDDIAFTDEDGVKLNHEIESYAGGHLIAWVKVPKLSATTDTVIYMYYGNPTASNQQSVPKTWASRYKMVQHFSEGSGLFLDSTWGKDDGTAVGGVTRVSGQIDGAVSFDGSSGYVEVPSSSDISGFTSGFTASAWVRIDDLSQSQSILHKYGWWRSRGWYLEYRVPERALAFYASPDGIDSDWWYASYRPTAGTWHYVTVTWAANSVPRFYVDGAQVSTVRSGTVSEIYDNTGSPLHIGKNTFDRGNELDGVVDEAHIADVARSSGWVRTEYNNQKNPATFYALGSEETSGGGTSVQPPIISNPNPSNNDNTVSYTISQLSFYIDDPQNYPMDYSVTTSPNIGSGSRSSVSDGRYSIQVNGLEQGKTYTWTIQVTNGQAWNERTYKFTTQDTQPPPPQTRDIPSWGYFGRLFELTNQQLIGIAENLDIIETRGRYANIEPMQIIREHNPDIKIISYYNIWTINEYSEDIDLARSRGWILLDSQGNEVFPKGWPQNKIIDVGNEDASDFIADKIKAVVDTYEFDGIKGDGTKAILETKYDISAMPVDPRTGKIYTLEDWRDAMIDHVTNIKNTMGSDKIYIGNGKGANVGSGIYGFWANEELVAPLLDAEDGCHLEGYIRWSNENWRSEARWVQDMEFVNYLCSNYKYALPVITTKGDMPPGATIEQVVLFGVATNLLAIESGMSYIGVSSETTAALEYLYELNDIPVGTPTESYSKRSGISVYEREFTNSLVLVNPSYDDYTINLGRTYYTTDGNSVSRITVYGHTGVILLKTYG